MPGPEQVRGQVLPLVNAPACIISKHCSWGAVPGDRGARSGRPPMRKVFGRAAMGGIGPVRTTQADAIGRVALDPRAILTSIGEVVYDWDVTTDRISWGVNAADILGAADLSVLSSGRELALATEPGS